MGGLFGDFFFSSYQLDLLNPISVLFPKRHRGAGLQLACLLSLSITLKCFSICIFFFFYLSLEEWKNKASRK